MTTVVSILISDLVPLRERGLWQGIINIIYASGSGIGAPLGQASKNFPNDWMLTEIQEAFWPITLDGDGKIFPSTKS